LSLAFRPRLFLQPQSESELLLKLKEYSGRARIVAGGTGLYETAHRGLLSDVEVLIDIGKLGLSYIKEMEGSIVIGSATVFSDLARYPGLSRYQLGAIADALLAIQPLQVKNVATVGGAICTALPFFDLPVALLALQARVGLSPGGRVLELCDFLKGYFAVDLSDEEFLREITVRFSNFDSSAFQKFALTHDDWALMNCAVALSLEKNGRKTTIKNARVFFGGGLPEKPARANHCEQNLIGLDATDSPKIKQVFEDFLSYDIDPATDIRSSSEYRLRIAKVLGQRTLSQAVERSQKTKPGL
jgi:aerobic carbon-monoxide dehydrogenase medium subunit